MSNVPFRLTVLTGCLALACACARTLTVTDTPELSLRAAASASVKADPELVGASLGVDNTYVILASASAAEEPEFMREQLFTYYSETAKWQASVASGPGLGGSYTHDPKFWPLGGVKVDFLALALKPAAYDALNATPGSISFYRPSDGGAAAGVSVVDWDTYADQYDVMYAVNNAQSSSSNPGGTVPLEFRHTMAVVGFTAKSASDAGVFTLKGLSLKDLQFRGSLVIDNTTTELGVNWIVPSGDENQCDKAVPLIVSEFSVPESSATAAAAKCTDHLLVIPQPSRTVKLTYHVKNSIPDLTYELPLPRTVWKAGHRYIYDLVFTPTEIRVSDVNVTTWDGTPVDDTAIISN